MIKAIIFDLDGTLCDTMDDLLTAMNGMLRSFGWPERTREDLLRFINRGSRKFVGDSMPEGSHGGYDSDEVTRALERYNECYAECYCDKTVPYAGMAQALAELGKEYKLGILSNKQDPFVVKIAETIFPGVFGSAHGNAPGIPTKPDPRSLDRTFAELGVTAEECVFIGDSDVDMKTALNAGMIPLAVTWGYRDRETLKNAGAELMCDEPMEIVECLRGIRGADASEE